MLLLSTASLTGYGLHRIFQFASKTWYTGIDIALGNLNFDLWDEDYIFDLAKEFNMPVLSLTAPGKGMSKKKLEKIMIIAKKLSVQLVTLSPPHITDKDTKWFGTSLVRIKRDTHISICVQNVEPKFLFFIIPEYRNATFSQIKTVTGDTTLDILWVDSSSSMDILKAQGILWKSVKNIFFSDKKGMKRGILPGGAGGWISHLPLESFLMKLKSTGYGWYITLKVNPVEIGVGNAERVEQNLEYMRSYYEKHFANFTS
jgi:sugar phosphate isomerase/epimerase